MKLGENILRLRKENKMSQEQLAEKINVTRQTISNWELGETGPTPEQLKMLSKIFKVSVDNLLDNDVENIIIEKVSNTEKLAGIMIKILKGIGIAFLVFLIIDVISFLLFVSIREESTTSVVKEVNLDCTINNNDYLITIGSDAYFNCSNCTKEIQNDINDLIDYSDIDKTAKEIEIYFNKKNGFCE